MIDQSPGRRAAVPEIPGIAGDRPVRIAGFAPVKGDGQGRDPAAVAGGQERRGRLIGYNHGAHIDGNRALRRGAQVIGNGKYSGIQAGQGIGMVHRCGRTTGPVAKVPGRAGNITVRITGAAAVKENGQRRRPRKDVGLGYRDGRLIGHRRGKRKGGRLGTLCPADVKGGHGKKGGGSA